MSLKITSTTQQEPPSDKKCRFLFVDDSPTDNKYLSLLIKIKKLPILPHFEYSATDALVYLQNCPKQEFPGIIMVDINMPLVNGFEFVERYLEQFKTTQPNTFIFITSSSIQIADRERAEMNPHIKGFIDKPFNLTHFNQQILPYIKSSIIN